MNSRTPTIIACTVACAIIVITLLDAYSGARSRVSSTSISDNSTSTMSTASSTMKIMSDAFSENQSIPTKYTCDGENESPALTISGVPAHAKSLTLILEDPDTSMGVFTHWVVFNIDPKTTMIPSEMTKTSPTFGTPGKNGAGGNDYIGPCPPTGKHRYFFKLFAVDTTLSLQPGSSKEDVLAAMNGHVIAETQLMGTYERTGK